MAAASGKQIDEFATSLADAVAKRYPPALDKAKDRIVSVNRVTRVLEDAFKQAVDFKSQHNLGVYKKARLGTSFKYELSQRGYSEKFVELATEGLIVYLTRQESKAAAKSGSRD